MPTLLRIRDPDHKALSRLLEKDGRVERRLPGWERTACAKAQRKIVLIRH